MPEDSSGRDNAAYLDKEEYYSPGAKNMRLYLFG